MGRANRVCPHLLVGRVSLARRHVGPSAGEGAAPRGTGAATRRHGGAGEDPVSHRHDTTRGCTRRARPRQLLLNNSRNIILDFSKFCSTYRDRQT